jgi:5-methylcytosine-specific restriction enzyme A
MIMTGYGTNQRKGASKSFYKTRQWYKSRNAAYKRDAGRCQKCGKLLMEKREYNIDHIVAINDDSPDFLKYDLSNLQTLCIPCHNHKRQTEQIEEAKYNANVVDDIFSQILEAN